MSFNLNFTHKNEYVLHTNLIDEVIRLYGVETRLIITKKANVDFSVFGDYSNIKSNGENILDVHVLAGDQSDIERTEYKFTDFGMNFLYSNEVYISSKEIEKYHLEFNDLFSALIIFPSNQVMEVTDVEHKNPGINNLWAYSDNKSSYKLTLRTYEFKLHDEIQQEDLINTLEIETKETEKEELGQEIENKIEQKKESYDVLDGYFETLLRKEKEQDFEAEVKDLTGTVEYKEPSLDNRDFKPIVNNSETDPFGW